MLIKLIKALLIVGLCFSISGATFKSPEDFYEQEQWEGLIQDIKNSPDTEIRIDWQGIGGYVAIERAFVAELFLIPKHIVINVVGLSASAHANAICAWHDVTFNRGVLLFHPVREYKNGPIKIQSTLKSLSPCIDKGYLTFSEMNRIPLESLRIYVYPDGTKKITND